MRPFLAALLLLASAAAGCADQNSPEPLVEPAAATPEAPTAADDEGAVLVAQAPDGARVETFVLHGNASGALFFTTLPEDDPVGMDVPVGPNATRIRATLAWTGAGSELDAVLVAPGHCPGESLDDIVPSLACFVFSAYGVQDDPAWHHARGGTPAAPDSPSALDLGQDVLAQHPCERRACAWTAIAYYNAAVQASFTYVVEVTYPAGDVGSEG